MAYLCYLPIMKKQQFVRYLWAGKLYLTECMRHIIHKSTLNILIVIQCPYLLYSSVMNIMLNNTDITLQLHYKTLDYEHSCVDLAEYCEYNKKIV